MGSNDAVLLLNGMRNPEEFRAGIVAILNEFKKFRSSGGLPPVLFLATVPFFCDRPETAALNGVVESVINPVLREIAVAEGAELVDQNLVLKNRPEWMASNCVHPNADGEKTLAFSRLRTVRAVFCEDRE
jgi:lysophospholipase L1-like esterase